MFLTSINETKRDMRLLIAGFHLEYASGIGVEGTYANFRVSCQNLQADDQSPFTRCAA